MGLGFPLRIEIGPEIDGNEFLRTSYWFHPVRRLRAAVKSTGEIFYFKRRHYDTYWSANQKVRADIEKTA